MMGFKDPKDEYPRKKITETKDHDVSRNASGKNILHNSTPVYHRHSKRIKEIPYTKGDEHDKWEEPFSAWDAKYPYNKVMMQSEANHIIEVDDTPGSERMNWQHQSGTYEEIDHTGSRAVKIVGDNYEIVVGEEFIYIKGNQKITVDGDVNWLFKRNFTMEVLGDTKMLFRGNVEQRTSGDHKMAVKGTMEQTVKGEFYCTGYSLGSFNFAGNMVSDAPAQYHQSGQSQAKDLPDMSGPNSPGENNRKPLKRKRDIRNHGAS